MILRLESLRREAAKRTILRPSSATEVKVKSSDIKEAERTLNDQKEHLKRAKNELDSSVGD